MRIQPDRATFRELSAQYSVVPVWTEVLADVETPVSAYLKLVGDEPGFLLESVEHGERWSRY
ncbi:MAG: anthranilate synthase component I, partial [Actinobacteria bacterium]|nr:anthranilate synthase component I [Actinomycetota bacterium]